MYNYGITCKQLPLPVICPDIKIFNNVTHINQHALADNIIASIATVSDELRKKITTTKRDIDKTYKNGSWDYVKTLTNPYELVFSGSKKFVGRDIKYVKHNICNYNPLSRSFFKMVEMGNVFLLNRIIKQISRNIKTLHLAEGPGGFIEGIIYLRKKYCPQHIQKCDLHYGITLIDNGTTTDIPSWKKSTVFIRDNPNIIITTGADNTGNLYNLDNIKYLQTRFGNTMDLVTADGGFDFSVDYNSQEYLASRLIYCEILSALLTLKPGGTFICKTFDLLNKLTVDFLYILQCKFEYIYVFKPKTSRLANSEKYLVCTGFRSPCSESELVDLCKVVTLFETVEKQNNKLQDACNLESYNSKQYELKQYTIINSLFVNGIPEPFVRFIKSITHTIITNQSENIIYTIKLINKLNYGKLYATCVNDIVQKQKQNAFQWCLENNMPINN